VIPSRARRSLPYLKRWAEVPFRVAASSAIRSERVAPGVTVVIVNWNSEPYLRVALRAIGKFGPSDTNVLVVDNSSRDKSMDLLRTHPGVRAIRLPANVGHWLALDLGFLLARTEFVVSLDVDAFPVAEGWLDRLLDPLRRGYDVAGAHVRHGIVHPCCLAMRLDRFVEKRHTFASLDQAGRGIVTGEVVGSGDVGACISLREEKRFLFDRTEAAGPGDVGSLWAGLVYHNFYSTRFGSRLPLDRDEVATGITPEAVADVWEAAVARHLGQGFDGGTSRRLPPS
jgi:glycosyltransferase involved in cell wall biosynthesis